MTTGNKEFVLSTGDLMKLTGAVSGLIVAIVTAAIWFTGIISANAKQTTQIEQNTKKIEEGEKDQKETNDRVRKLEEGQIRIEGKIDHIIKTLEKK